MTDHQPGPVPKEALAYFRAKKIKPGFDYRDIWREEHATAFTVAKAMKIDVLESIHDALNQALTEGRTFAQFKNDLTPTLQALGWWGKQQQIDPHSGDNNLVQLGSPRRLKTIYDTNLRTARAAGQWQRIQRTKATRPYLQYNLGPSEHHRAQHAAWNGLVLPVDDPFWSTHMTPNGWGCKCWVRSLAKAEGDRLGVNEAPPEQTQEWLNKRTGAVEQIPAGIDPGFDTNPGAVARTEYAARVFGIKITSASAPIGSVAMQSAADFVRAGLQLDYQRWAQALYRQQREHLGETRLVGVVGSDIIAALRQRAVALDTAAITIKDKEIRHLARDDKRARDQSLPEAAVLDLPNRLDHPQAVLLDRDDNSLIYVFPLDGEKLAKVVIAPGLKSKGRVNGKRERVQTNAVRTATIVERGDLPANRFETIKGAL